MEKIDFNFEFCENEPLSLGSSDAKNKAVTIYLTRDFEGSSADLVFLVKVITLFYF